MRDLTDVILRLKNIKGDISLFDWNNMGLNQYYIKKLVEEGILFKVGRAKYQVGIPNHKDNLIDNLTTIKKEEKKEDILIENASSYVDVSKYQEEITQINSLIQSEDYNGLSIYVSGVGYSDERLLDLEKYVLEKMYNLGLFDEAEPYYKDLEDEKKTKSMLDEMLTLKMKS